ncbi:MAG: efflux RND transporter permease subunit [Bacteroidota bacterium]|nr:efflux RND transporter permease subunit [Bacteroidota bacterium]
MDLNKYKHFGPTSWSVNNKTAIYIMTFFFTLFGIISYINLPKASYPDIVIPTIFVSTIYPGTSPVDIENLVTRKLEKQIKSLNGVKKVSSNSIQDFSNVIVEFNANVPVEIAKQRVKDAVDKARQDLPKDLPTAPSVIELNFSDIPVMFVNISGNYPDELLKKYAKDAKDKIEGLKEISRIDLVGARDREVQIDVDMYKMQQATITLGDIERAVAYENLTVSAGTIKMDEMKRAVRISGQFTDPKKIEDIVIKSAYGSPVYLKDIATVNYTFEEQESYARLAHKPVITLNVVKRAGENLLTATDKVREIMAELQKNKYPKDLKVVITGDQSTLTRTSLHDLINTIIIGFILVTVVLMFFMGVTNAIFVGLSVPLSMFVAFMLMPSIGFSLNFIVLFAFLFALGIVVDDAIVVIENTHRIYHDEHISIVDAAKKAAGEVFVPVLAGTLTTLAPFVPLLFWPGIVGKFMYYLPVTLIITLLASLFVAFIINPVFAVNFMSKEEKEDPKKSFFQNNKWLVISILIFLSSATIAYMAGNFGLGNFLAFLAMLLVFNKFVLTGAIKGFQQHFIPALVGGYEKIITWSLRGRHTAYLLIGTVFLFFGSIGLIIVRKPQVYFFPSADPNFIYVNVGLPIGTHQSVTDSITKIVEDKVFQTVGENNPIVESIISNVTYGTNDPSEQDPSPKPNKGKVSVSFVEFGKRNGASTKVYLDQIRNAIQDIPGTEITVSQESNGPPTGKPIELLISGDEFSDLIQITSDLKAYINAQGIPGIEELKSDLEESKPEIVIEIDRDRANREGLSTGQIGLEVRNAIYGKEISKFKDGEDENPIMLRYQPSQRNKIDELLNLKITFRDMGMNGAIRQIPLSSVAKISYGNSYGGIKRRNNKRVVSLGSNVLTGYAANDIVPKIEASLKNFPLKDGYEIKMGGEQEDQAETSNFLGVALLISIGLILFILVVQFNSLSKPLIILTEIVFSIIGVFLGVGIFNMDFVIVMTGVGILGLAGIVVKNGILILEFTEELRARGLPIKEALIQAGKTRLSPVLLTATATTLGLVPLAVGFNIDFVTIFTELNPHIYFGGDNVAFWGPLSWTMIFGLIFATLITLILVPCMYYISERIKAKVFKKPLE